MNQLASHSQARQRERSHSQRQSSVDIGHQPESFPINSVARFLASVPMRAVDILALQRVVGNQAIATGLKNGGFQRAVSGPPIQRNCGNGAAIVNAAGAEGRKNDPVAFETWWDQQNYGKANHDEWDHYGAADGAYHAEQLLVEQGKQLPGLLEKIRDLAATKSRIAARLKPMCRPEIIGMLKSAISEFNVNIGGQDWGHTQELTFQQKKQLGQIQAGLIKLCQITLNETIPIERQSLVKCGLVEKLVTAISAGCHNETAKGFTNSVEQLAELQIQ